MDKLKLKDFSTDLLDHEKFRPHGRVEFSIGPDGIVHYTALGPFNEELITMLSAAREKYLSDLHNRHPNWRELVEFRSSCLATQTTLRALETYLLSIKNTALEPSATAFVISDDVEGQALMTQLYPACYEAADIPFYIVNNIEDARHWLNRLE